MCSLHHTEMLQITTNPRLFCLMVRFATSEETVAWEKGELKSGMFGVPDMCVVSF